MPTYRVKVIRHQIWNLNIAADSPEAAREEADKIACECPPHDDYAYDTEVIRETDKEPDNA